MKEESKWENLMVKFLNKEANQQELDILDTWLNEPKNILEFRAFVETEYLTAASMKNYDIKNAKKVIDKKVRKQRKKERVLTFTKLAIAASVALIVALSIYDFKKEPLPKIVQQEKIIQSGTNKAILTLGNGNEIALEKGKEYRLRNVTSNGQALVYNNNEKNSEEEVKYNYLTIPRGGQFKVLLSDETVVWLNSDSKLKYPTAFSKNDTRAIELVYGEAYLEVSPSSKNNGTGFTIRSKGQEIHVLGTHFNLKAYADENQVATTLVEGKVRVKTESEEHLLKPNQQSIITDDLDKIEIRDIDASQEISWVKGLFTFNEESLEEIMKILSRWYDINVVFESAEMKNYTFTGILERTGSFVDIIELIEATSENEVIFEISDKTVTIK